MKKYGLIGFPLSHSFSKQYFSEKFKRENRNDCQYELYEIPEISRLPALLENEPDLLGLNVTIPYKQKVIPFLDRLDPACKQIGAVNCIKISKNECVGYNTDYFGFRESLGAWLGNERPRALVLGTGGASKAVGQALDNLGIRFLFVSRTSAKDILTYKDLKSQSNIIKDHPLVINTTPLGTYPNVNAMPEFPIEEVGPNHRIYDLIYNPEQTMLMKEAAKKGARTKNGMEMLRLQAEAAWDIWQ